MMIEDNTYEKTRKGSPSSRSDPASQHENDFFSNQYERHSEQKSQTREEYPTRPSRTNHVIQSKGAQARTDHNPKKQQIPETVRKERQAKSRDESKSLQPGLKRDFEQKNIGVPTLRHKDRFLVINDDDSGADSPQHSIEKLQHLRQAIREGKLERVAPGSVSAQETSRPAPPRPAQSPHRRPVASGLKTKGHEKTKSTTSKWAQSFKVGADALVDSFESGTDITKSVTGKSAKTFVPGAGVLYNSFGTGADVRGKDFKTGVNVLEETKRELKAKFRPPYEHLRFPKFSACRRVSYHSLKSDESFFCQGEYADLQTSQHREDAKQEETMVPGSSARERVEIQPHLPPTHCRLCRKPAARSVRSLCNACEDEFTRRQRLRQSSEEVKPIPRPKDQKRLPAERLTRNHGQAKHVANHIREDVNLQPKGPLKAMRFGTVERKPVFHSPDLRRPRSQTALIEGLDSEYEESIEEEHTLKPDTFEGVHVRQTVLKGKTAARNSPSGYYGFWDEVLGDEHDSRPK